MKYVANTRHTHIRTVGLNVQIIREDNVGNTRFLVVLVKRWNDKELKANCGNYQDAEKFAYSC